MARMIYIANCRKTFTALLTQLFSSYIMTVTLTVSRPALIALYDVHVDSRVAAITSFSASQTVDSSVQSPASISFQLIRFQIASCRSSARARSIRPPAGSDRDSIGRMGAFCRS